MTDRKLDDVYTLALDWDWHTGSRKQLGQIAFDAMCAYGLAYTKADESALATG